MFSRTMADPRYLRVFCPFHLVCRVQESAALERVDMSSMAVQGAILEVGAGWVEKAMKRTKEQSR